MSRFSGGPYPSYSETDHDTWRRYFARFERRMDEFGKHVHPIFKDHIGVLEPFRSRIPTLTELRETLAPIGWDAQYVQGYVPPWQIGALLSDRIMPISQSIRGPEELEFARQPDLIHDVFGHLPPMFDARYQNLRHRWAKLVSEQEITHADRASYHLNKMLVEAATLDEEPLSLLKRAINALNDLAQLKPTTTALLDKVYFWVIEFGVIKTDGFPLILGAGLLSSLGEIPQVLADDVVSREISMQSILATYEISEQQSSYLVAESFSAFEKIVDQLQLMLLDPQLLDAVMHSAHGGWAA